MPFLCYLVSWVLIRFVPVVAEGHSRGKKGISILDVLTDIVFFSSSPKPLTTHPSAFTERNMSPSQVTDQTIFPGGMEKGK